MFPIRALARLLAVSALGLLVALPAGAGTLTPQEEAGRRIYHEGASPSGALLQALVGPQSTPVAGSTLPCVNCHGADGLGRPEGAVKPSIITWRELSKSYGHRHENGREHPAFNEQGVVEALTFGKDPAGNRLDSAMPRYVMSHADLSALIAYLKKIDADVDPGIAPERLRIGLLLPTQGRLAELGQAVSGVIQAYVDGINDKGGIFGRKIELVRAEFADDPKQAVANAERLVRQENVFALLNPFTAGVEREISRLAEEAKIPVVGPFTLFPDSTLAVNRYTFFVLPGLREQGMALARFAVADLKLDNPAVAIVHPAGDGYADTVQAVEGQLKERRWERIRRATYAPGQLPDAKLVGELQQRGVQVVFFLGSDAELAALGRLVRDAIWSPYLLAPGAKVARAAADLPTTFGNRVYLAYPSLPRDVTAKGAAAMAEMQKKRNLGNRHQPAQISAYASAQVLEEGLKRAGRDLSRARLVDNLENLFSFESNVTPSISYGPNRRIGALGAHIVRVDLSTHSFQPVGSYVRLD